MIQFTFIVNKLRDIERDAQSLLSELDARPLSARSLLLSFLLGSHPPDVSSARLVSFGRLFGLRDGTVRTALSRMVAAGEADVSDRRYRLAGRLLERQREQDLGQQPPIDEWDGSWWTAIVVAGDRSMTERRRFRSAMSGARFGELRPDLWMRPANTHPPVAPPGVLVTAGPIVSGDDTSLTERLWDTASIERISSRLGGVLDRLGDELEVTTAPDDDGSVVLPLTFVVSAACVRHLRVEPQLPAALADMPASRTLRSTYAEVNQRFRAALDVRLRADAGSIAT